MVKILKGRDLDVEGRIILEWILDKENVKFRTGQNCIRTCQITDFCGQVNETFDYVRLQNFLIS
jgi:hypothetical protein